MYHHNSRRGFTLLLAALVSSIVLSLGASIFVLARKQVTLSSLGRDSQTAFYAADQAAECALYWDSRWNYFGTTTPAVSLTPAAPLCSGTAVTVTQGSPTLALSNPYPYSITFEYAPSAVCATVTVTKTLSGTVISSAIHADGYNTSCATRQTNPRTLQRSVELKY